jgi:hypothetical protein
VARTSDLSEAQDAMQSVFLPLRMQLHERAGGRDREFRLNPTQIGALGTGSFVDIGR